MQHNLQQTCTFRLLLAFGCASASIISLLFTSINIFTAITYKTLKRPSNPKVAGSSPAGRVFLTPKPSNNYACILFPASSEKPSFLPKWVKSGSVRLSGFFAEAVWLRTHFSLFDFPERIASSGYVTSRFGCKVEDSFWCEDVLVDCSYPCP